MAHKAASDQFGSLSDDATGLFGEIESSAIDADWDRLAELLHKAKEEFGEAQNAIAKLNKEIGDEGNGRT